jgi:hypothetical protein
MYGLPSFVELVSHPGQSVQDATYLLVCVFDDAILLNHLIDVRIIVDLEGVYALDGHGRWEVLGRF